MPAWTVAYIYGFWVLLFASCVASLRLGDAAVRTAAAMLGAAMLAGLAAISSSGWSQFETAALVVDILFMVGLMAWAVRWPRWWLVAMAAIQMLVLAGYLAKALYPGISRLTYAILIGTGPYFQLILLNIGLWLVIRTRRRATDRRA